MYDKEIFNMKNAIDGSLGTAAISSPAWLPLLTQGSAAVAAMGGAILVVLRIWFTLEERAEKRRKNKDQA